MLFPFSLMNQTDSIRWIMKRNSRYSPFQIFPLELFQMMSNDTNSSRLILFIPSLVTLIRSSVLSHLTGNGQSPNLLVLIFFPKWLVRNEGFIWQTHWPLSLDWIILSSLPFFTSSESVNNGYLNLERLSRSARIAQPGISALERHFVWKSLTFDIYDLVPTELSSANWVRSLNKEARFS